MGLLHHQLFIPYFRPQGRKPFIFSLFVGTIKVLKIWVCTCFFLLMQFDHLKFPLVGLIFLILILRRTACRGHQKDFRDQVNSRLFYLFCITVILVKNNEQFTFSNFCFHVSTRISKKWQLDQYNSKYVFLSISLKFFKESAPYNHISIIYFICG